MKAVLLGMLKCWEMQRMVCAAARLGYHKRTDLRRWCCGRRNPRVLRRCSKWCQTQTLPNCG
ncbi:MAG: hypothetical protein DWI67_05835 [Chloroflexi bacterium]|nr:MAG: hypothetical protein DWI67_05835 [Chloroflexota bacterium]